MLFITGLLTLLAIAQAGGEQIKGGSRIKGGSLLQEKVAQEDIIVSPLNIKTGASYGTKVIRDGTGDTIGRVKTAHSPSLHHAVKTVADLSSGKLHPSSGVHHAAISPVVQDQVSIDDPASPSGIKTLKSAASVKARFSPQDGQIRDPVAHPVVRVQQITNDPAVDSIKTVKTLQPDATGKTRFAQEDMQVRDPVARPVIQTVKTVADPVADSVKTLRTVGTGKTRFAQEDMQVRDPVVQTVKSLGDSLSPIITKQSVKTVAKTAQSSSPRTKTSVKTSQQKIDSQRVSGVPESVVSAARRNTIASTQSSRRSQSRTSSTIDRNPGGVGAVNVGDGLTLDEVTLQALQNAGGVVIENGEISVNQIGLEMLKSMRGNVLQHSSGFISTDEDAPISLNAEIIDPRRPEVIASTPLLRAEEFGQRQRVSSQRVSTDSRRTASSISTRSGGDQTLHSDIGGTRTSIIRGPQSPVMLQPSTGIKPNEISGIGGLRFSMDNSQIQRPVQPIRQGQRRPSSTSSGLRSEIRTTSRVSTEALRRRSGPTGTGPVGSTLTTTNVNDNTRVLGFTEEIFGSRASTGIRQPTAVTDTDSIFFNGKEINISGLREGQIFDENLRPISSGETGSTYIQDAKTFSLSENAAPENAAVPAVRLSAARGSAVSTGSSRRRSGVIQEIRRAQNSGISAESGLRRQDTIGGSTTIGSRSRIISGNFGMRQDTRMGTPLSGLGGSQTSIQNVAGNTVLQRTPGMISGQAPRSRLPKPAATYGSDTGTLSITRSQQQIVAAQKEKLKLRRPVVSPVAMSGQFLGGSGQQITDSGTVLFNGKEINVSGLKEGQLFDENLQPILPGSSPSIDVNTLNVPQLVNPVSRPAARNQQQRSRIQTERTRLRSPVSTSITSAGQSIGGGSAPFNLQSQGISPPSEVRKPAQIKPISRQTKPRAGYNQGTLSTRITVPSSNVLETGRVGGQTTATKTETVLFNGKEINIDGVREGQLFDENLQPILPGTTNDMAVDFKVPTNIQPATRTAIRRQQSVIIPKDKVILKAPTPQVFRSGQASSETTGDIQFNLGIQTISGGSGTLRQIQTNPISGQRRPQDTTRYSQGIRSSIQRQSNTQGSGLSGGLVRSSGIAGIGGQTTATRTETVLFNGKEINIGGLREGQIFDENLKPILPGSTNDMTKDLKSSTILQPATRTTIRRQQSVITPKDKVILRTPASQVIRSGQSLSGTTGQFNLGSQTISGGGSGALKEIQIKPVSRQRRPQEITSYNQEIRSSVQRQSNTQGSGLSGGLVRSSGISAIRGQTTATRAETVLFNGKEINVGGLREGQLFDENLQPISPGSAKRVDLKASDFGQNIKPARRTVVQNRFQSVSSDGVLKPAQIKPLRRQRKPQESTVIGYNQRILSTSQRQPDNQGDYLNRRTIDSIQAGLTEPVSNLGGQTIATKAETVMFNGKEIHIDGLREGQLFDENLQPISPGGVESSKPLDLKATYVPQNVQPVRTIVRNQPQSGRIPNDKVILRASAGSSPVIPPGQSFTETQRIPQGVVPASYSQRIRPTVQRQPSIQRNYASTRGTGSLDEALGGTGSIVRTPFAAGIGQQAAVMNSDTVLFNGKEINIRGLQEGQIFDENLQPILRGGHESAKATDLKSSDILKNIRPGSRTGTLRSSAVSTDISRDSVTTARVGSSQVSRQRTVSSGQLRQRKPIVSSSQTSSISGQRLSSANQLAISPGVARTTSGARLSSPQGVAYSPSRFQSIDGARTSDLRRNQVVSSSDTLGGSGLLSSQVGISKDISSETGKLDSLTSGTVLFNGKEINIDGLTEGQLFDENLQPILSGNSGLSRDSGVLSETGNLRSATPGLSQASQLRKPGRIASRTASLQRSQTSAGTLSRNSATGLGTRGATTISRQSGSMSATDSTSGSSGRRQIIEGILPLNEGVQTFTTTGTGAGLRNAALPQRSPVSVTSSDRGSGIRRQSVSGEGASAAAFDSLGYIDVTRSRGSDVSPRIPSIENPSTASLYGSRGIYTGSRIPQGKMSQDSITQQKQEAIFLNTPDVQQRIQESDPSTKTISLKGSSDPLVQILTQKALQSPDSRQTQLKIEDVLQQSSLSKPEAFRTVQVQETVPFGGQDPSSPGIVSKKTLTKITQVSQKNIDIPTVQQKLLGGDFSEYLPKTSFLPPFNYALPKLSASKYGVKTSPIVQEQQKLEQVFV